jgi:hypothetical protein
LAKVVANASGDENMRFLSSLRMNSAAKASPGLVAFFRR